MVSVSHGLVLIKPTYAEHVNTHLILTINNQDKFFLSALFTNGRLRKVQKIAQDQHLLAKESRFESDSV